MAAQLPVNKSIPIDVLQEVEPGLEENKDFRTKLRKADDAKIDTTAAFPSQKKNPEQVDFRNVLRKTTGPEKKSFKVEQVDFRENIKRKVGVDLKKTSICSNEFMYHYVCACLIDKEYIKLFEYNNNYDLYMYM